MTTKSKSKSKTKTRAKTTIKSLLTPNARYRITDWVNRHDPKGTGQPLAWAHYWLGRALKEHKVLPYKINAKGKAARMTRAEATRAGY